MKKLVIMMMLLAFVGANVAIAADSYTYENKKGTVTFDHKAHQDNLGDCAKCHEGEPAKIDVDKDFGHKTCKACHKEMKKGPTKCNDCHKK
jgi:cytochrome c553